MNLASIVVVVCAYLLGSISFAVVFSKAFGIADPRTYGSGNPGATNVLRSGNKAAAILTLVFDALKGWLPVVVARIVSARFGFDDATVAAVAVAAFLGHLYPVYHRFHGGKGVATALGVLVGLSTSLALATIATFLVVLVFFRWVSFASMVAAVFAVFWHMLSVGVDRAAGRAGIELTIDPVAVALIVIATLLVVRHRPNIARLRAGTEPKLGRASR